MNPRSVFDLETPAVLIDLDCMAHNIAAMQAYCNRLGLRFRPHIKTHKIPAIARLQLEAGAVGIACQKTTEAVVFVDAGLDDIQIPYNVMGPQKTARLAKLAQRITITAAADNRATVAGLGEAAADAGITLNVLADLATDLQRTGTTVDGVIALAKQIDAHPHLHFAGLLVYPSRALMRPAVQEALARLSEAGIACENVSGGGTPASAEAGELPELTEVRAGTYVFNDWTMVRVGRAGFSDCAMRVAATVVSAPAPERAILDSGSKTLSSDHLEGLYGHIVEYPDARIYRLNEEHAYVDVSACPTRPAIGERVHIIPVHTCVVSNLHDQLFGVRGENVEVIWPVAARGKVW